MTRKGTHDWWEHTKQPETFYTKAELLWALYGGRGKPPHYTRDRVYARFSNPHLGLV